jgi:hypothetical protein
MSDGHGLRGTTGSPMLAVDVGFAWPPCRLPSIGAHHRCICADRSLVHEGPTVARNGLDAWARSVQRQGTRGSWPMLYLTLMIDTKRRTNVSYSHVSVRLCSLFFVLPQSHIDRSLERLNFIGKEERTSHHQIFLLPRDTVDTYGASFSGSIAPPNPLGSVSVRYHLRAKR